MPNTLYNYQGVSLFSVAPSLIGRGAVECGGLPILISVHDARHNRVCIGARADDEQNHQEERLEIEKSGL